MRYAISVVCLLSVGSLQAAELRQPLPEVHAIVDVPVVTAPGQRLESATVVIRDGVIEAVGADLAPPPDAAIVRFEREDDQPPVTLYPGLIEPYLPVGGDGGSEDQENETEDADAPDELPPGRHPLIRPDRRIEPASWPADRVEAHRRAGFTTALLVPSGGLLRGQSTLANLGEGGLSGNLLARDVAQHAYLHERVPDGGYPNSLMGAVALFRQTLLDAAWQRRAREAWRDNPAQTRPEWLPGLDALAPVLAGEQPLMFEARDALDSLRIVELVDEDMDLVLVGHGAEYQRLDDFDSPVRHVLPLDFPEAPDVEDENDRDASLEALRHWRRAPANPARLVEAGMPVTFTAHGQSQPAELFGQIARAIEHGLDPETALAALTTVPAEWLGIEDRAGRIAPGYMANLVVVEGELLTEKPTISEVWVDGHRFELAKLEPPQVDPAGTWALTLNLGSMGEVDGELKLSGDPADMQGSLTIMGNETELSQARVSGKQLQIRIEAARFGGAGTISINLDIEGDRGRGTGSGPFGEFTVRGRRTSGPGEEIGGEEAST